MTILLILLSLALATLFCPPCPIRLTRGSRIRFLLYSYLLVLIPPFSLLNALPWLFFSCQFCPYKRLHLEPDIDVALSDLLLRDLHIGTLEQATATVDAGVLVSGTANKSRGGGLGSGSHVNIEIGGWVSSCSANS